ncbi:MAG: prephenate dehydrogenase [Bacteroidota bacterium]|nr:prephenate dehydrogenase [Bacteroidota bacterium]
MYWHDRKYLQGSLKQRGPFLLFKKQRNMKLTIIGLGLIGGSMAKDLKKSNFATEIVGVDANPAHQKEALKLGLVDRIEEFNDALKQTDLVIIAIPVDKILTVLPHVLDLIDANTTVTDVGSTKKVICNAVKDHPKRGNFVPSHPMSGTENFGPRAAIENLFEGKISIICDHQQSKPQHLALVEKMYQALGMDIAYMTSDEQDHTTAYVSHLPHVTSFALANTVLNKQKRKIIFDLASGGFQSTVRLAKSSPEMWVPIFRQNKEYVIESLAAYIKNLEEMKSAIEDESSDKLLKLVQDATKIREVLDKKNPYLIKRERKIVKLYTR